MTAMPNTISTLGAGDAEPADNAFPDADDQLAKTLPSICGPASQKGGTEPDKAARHRLRIPIAMRGDSVESHPLAFSSAEASVTLSPCT